MHHINSLAYFREDGLFVLGDKKGSVELVKSEDLKTVSLTSVGSTTIQAISVCDARHLVATLNKDFTITILKVSYENLEIVTSINSLEYMVEDGYQIAFSESQEIAFNPGGHRIAVNGPTGQTLIFDLNDAMQIVAWRSLRHESPAAPTTAAWASDTVLLVGLIDGSIVRYDYQSEHQTLTRIEGINETIHWFEREPSGTWLVATDARRLVRFDDRTLEYEIGPPFANDDFEHVTREPSTGKIFASSFDRNVYEIDPLSLAPTRVAFKAPFKLRWIRAGTEAGAVKLYLQVRNGSFLKVDYDTGHVEAAIHTALPALWSAAYFGNDLVIGGEGGLFRAVGNTVAGWPSLGDDDIVPGGHYIKRLVSHGNKLACGTSAKTMVLVDPDGIRRREVGAAVRDLAFVDADTVLACLEDGSLVEIPWRHSDACRTVFKSASEPLWSLAIHPDNRTVAVGERMGRIVILTRDDAGEMQEVIDTSSRIPKRMKWLNQDVLLAVHSSAIDRITCIDGKWRHDENFYNGQSNTVEDFLALENGKFLVGITYNKLIMVWDVATGELLSSSYWDFDYAKGMIRVQDSESEFLVYGRDMIMKQFCLHDAQVICLKIFEKTKH
ncbi:WD40 repeat domain-containing protein [Burkholderia sola]|uniref:WD40 repeat domain-containing protein n=1 Tax=Burkholderia sola TaxID=2843302 RepID=UPI0023DDD10B|nr:WD40 repeat domain-containing protein [Burkholderia sola]MDF3083640.1 WD40 repeat domain-containing protein [Burkholderia sola]